MIDGAFLAGLNHLLQRASWARTRLAPFAGRHALIGMPPFQLAFAISYEGRFEPAPDSSSPDVTIHLPADTPFLLLQGLDKVMAAARVEGNAEFATELSFIFRNLRWDAEEDLSRIVGDIAAHRLVAGAQRMAAWQKQAAENLTGNLAEYLKFESRLLIGTDEFIVFREDVLRLNAALDSLENRCKIAR
jgi:ubiquinone biosynthesis accessory factor UbiJ